MKGPTETPAVHLVLRAYPPAPARVALVPQPLSGRVLRTLVSLSFFWGILPWVVWIPPHYPWPVLSFCTGAYLAHLFWTGRFRVRGFAGRCPRCGGELGIQAGTRIDLPHTLTCFTCHFEPRLEVRPAVPLPDDPRALRHAWADCAGSWREEWMWDEVYVVCGGCGIRHRGSPRLRAAARAENERGLLLARLTEEGRFL